MIPTGGFIPQGQNTPGLMLNEFLPVPFEGLYTDSTKNGKPHDVVGSVAGYSMISLVVDAPHKQFTAKLQQRGTHGLALIDRIE